MTQFYAGIGSRETPEPILLEMSTLAMRLALKGWCLRSGGAQGADIAFENGSDMVAGQKVIRCNTLWQPALDHAAQFHPAWHNCDEYAQGKHARNSLIMLGDKLDLPVSLVVCWTPGGAVTGGTGQALRIAAHHSVPVFNLAVPGNLQTLMEWIDAA